MYHIKPDKRSRNSAEEIVRGLELCLKTMPLSTITVSDIYRATGISRATFYRLFDTTEDVLCYQLDQMMERSAEIWDPRSRSLLEEKIAPGMEHREFLSTLVENGRFDLLFRYTESTFRDLDARYRIFPQGMEAMEREYVMAQLSMNMVAALITWNRNGQKESLEDQARFLRSYVRVLAELFGQK